MLNHAGAAGSVKRWATREERLLRGPVRNMGRQKNRDSDSPSNLDHFRVADAQLFEATTGRTTDDG
jgi:hypothetical protein